MKHKFADRFGKWLAVLSAALCAAVLVFSPAGALKAKAAGSDFTLYTQYPGVTANAGDTVNFSLNLKNSTEDDVNTAVSVDSVPEGWTAQIDGGGRHVSNVFALAGETTTAGSLSITVPADCTEGSYKLSVKAQGGGHSSVLQITMNINEKEAGVSELVTEYPEQEGMQGTSFTFNTTIQNKSLDVQNYSLAYQAPDGWNVGISPSGDSTKIASIEVKGNSSQVLNIAITPAETAEAGEYVIPVSAISANETLNTELKVTITGSYQMEMATPSGLLSFDASANKQSAVTLTVTNKGNVDLENINMRSNAPANWTVEFSQSTIDVLKAGQSQEVTAYITPSKDAMTGDYVLQLGARNTETTKQLDFRVTVKTETYWGVVGVALIAAVFAGLMVIFHKFGRH